MNCKINLNMDNAAFGDAQPNEAFELARILRVTADKLEKYGPVNEITCLDANGNTVGSLIIKGKRT